MSGKMAASSDTSWAQEWSKPTKAAATTDTETRTHFERKPNMANVPALARDEADFLVANYGSMVALSH